MAATLEDTIMEEREELVVSPKLTQHENPIRKTAPFLKPSANSIDVQPFSFNHSSAAEMCSLKVSFNGWRGPQKNWKVWVDRMRSLHKSTWKKAGIYHAVLNSSYEITKNEDLILGFAEKWCHDTNTFVFVWGETTITLEDMMVIGGYSVLGESVLSVLENEESKTILAKLNEARVELTKSTSNKAAQSGWMTKFKDSGSKIEHEAFLVLWLSRFVFPSSSTTVARNVFPIAVHLARGTKLALAPAVLASLYRDLNFLKAKIVVGSNNLENDVHDDETTITVWAPLQIVQIWIWERFPKHRRKKCWLDRSNPRFARWEKKEIHKKNVGSFLDCALEDFSWQPYVEDSDDDLGFTNVYQEEGRWVVVGDSLDEELESWARCLRVSELVGIDGKCIEQYLPHRVAMQFGMNQDVPGDVPRADANPEIAWRFYTRPIKDVKLYIPSRFSKPYVTARYLEWRNKSTGACSLLTPVSDNEAEKSVKEESRSEGSKDFFMAGDDDDTLGLELEARICKLEKVFEYLKAKRNSGMSK